MGQGRQDESPDTGQIVRFPTERTRPAVDQDLRWLPQPEPPGGWDAYDAKVRDRDDHELRTIRAREQLDRFHLMTSKLCEFPRDATFDAMAVEAGAPAARATPAVAHARAFRESSAGSGLPSRSCLCLSGGTGVGKTVAATWLAFVAGGPAPGYIRAQNLESRGRYDRPLRDWLHSRTCVVVDDLGTEVMDAHGNFKSFFDEVVDSCKGERMPLVITTNLTQTTILSRYGERVASRLYEVGVWGGCGAEDLRRERRH